MVALLKRVSKLKAKLLAIRTGLGAAQLSPEVSRIHLKFAFKNDGGHFGPRKFWRLYLPPLKYHNPAVPMTVERTTDQEGPATMTVHFGEGDANVKEIPMRHRHEKDIWNDFVKLTDAKVLPPTPADIKLQQHFKDMAKKREVLIATKERVEAEKANRAVIAEQIKAGVYQPTA